MNTYNQRYFLPIMIVLSFLFSSNCLANDDKYIWKKIDSTSGRRATLSTSWDKGKMHFDLLLNSPNDFKKGKDLKIQFLGIVPYPEPVIEDKIKEETMLFSDYLLNKLQFDLKRPIFHFHISLDDSFRDGTNESLKIVFKQNVYHCIGSIELDRHSYKRIIKDGNWELGIARYLYSRQNGWRNPNSNPPRNEFYVEYVYGPREWDSSHSKFVSVDDYYDVCRKWMSGQPKTNGKYVWYKQKINEKLELQLLRTRG